MSVKSWSWQISQVAFYCWLRVGQVLVNILMDCHYDSIGRASAMYQWTISTVWVRYWWCISWLSALPEQFFFQPHNQGFALCYKVHVNWHVVDTITKSWAIFIYRPDISVVCQLMYQLLYRMSISECQSRVNQRISRQVNQVLVDDLSVIRWRSNGWLSTDCQLIDRSGQLLRLDSA